MRAFLSSIAIASLGLCAGFSPSALRPPCRIASRTSSAGPLMQQFEVRGPAARDPPLPGLS